MVRVVVLTTPLRQHRFEFTPTAIGALNYLANAIETINDLQIGTATGTIALQSFTMPVEVHLWHGHALDHGSRVRESEGGMLSAGPGNQCLLIALECSPCGTALRAGPPPARAWHPSA